MKCPWGLELMINRMLCRIHCELDSGHDEMHEGYDGLQQYKWRSGVTIFE